MTVKCEKDHITEKFPMELKKGSGCNICRKEYENSHEREEAILRLEQIKSKIENKGGKLLTDKYINRNSKIKFICENNHETEILAGSILDESWCNICNNNNKSKIAFEKYKNKIEEIEGECITTL